MGSEYLAGQVETFVTVLAPVPADDPVSPWLRQTQGIPPRNNVVYIETSIVSYLTARPSRDVVVAAHHDTHRQRSAPK